ncbi:hypothetical protein ACVDG3_01475 [Meridianimarinicoccus sp. RP-17]|nr:hypothetical protein [Phycocomes zhengii]
MVNADFGRRPLNTPTRVAGLAGEAVVAVSSANGQTLAAMADGNV